MTDKELNKLIKRIQEEQVEYLGVINFASKGILINTEGLLKAFQYGVDVGVECMKKDAIRIIKELSV
jgi:hypothetical protein